MCFKSQPIYCLKFGSLDHYDMFPLSCMLFGYNSVPTKHDGKTSSDCNGIRLYYYLISVIHRYYVLRCLLLTVHSEELSINKLLILSLWYSQNMFLSWTKFIIVRIIYNQFGAKPMMHELWNSLRKSPVSITPPQEKLPPCCSNLDISSKSKPSGVTSGVRGAHAPGTKLGDEIELPLHLRGVCTVAPYPS